MNFTEYHAAAKALSSRPPVSDHPEGQKFRIGERVRIVNPQSWFAKREIGNVFTVEYSYHQKYPEMSDGDRNKREYALRGKDGNSTAWYDEEELELVKAEE